MYMIAGITAVSGGILCIPGIYTRINLKASDVHIIVPYFQGIIGSFMCLWGIFLIIHAVFFCFEWLSEGWILYWLTYFIAGVCNTFTGFLFGFGLIQRVVIRKLPGELVVKAQEQHRTLTTIQILSGCVSIAAGAWTIVFNMLTIRI